MAPLRAVLAAALWLAALAPAWAQSAGDPAPAALGPLSPGLGPSHALAMLGAPALPADFTHFPYANPDAPKGGTLVIGETGTFDNLNPFIVPLGRPMWHMRFPRRVFEPLMMRSKDEPFTLYCLLCETVEVPDDRSWIAFTMREGVRFSDGTPLTAEDVLFSFDLLKEKGRPHYRTRFGKVARIDRPDARTIRFVFQPGLDDRELPLLMALMSVFSRSYYADEDFSKTTLKPPVGSGPYVVSKVDAGRSLTFARNPEYWGADLPVNRGFNNVAEIRYEYFRDANAAFEAFKAGAVHVRIEPDSNTLRWARGYDFAAARDGRVKRGTFEPPSRVGMLGLAMNTRRPLFQDRRVREALIAAFDFPWMNENYFFGSYERARSFFPVSDLAADGPATALERDLLAPFPDAVTPEVMARGFAVDETADYYTRTRAGLTRAMRLFREAGYTVRNERMVNGRTGTPVSFEIMIEHLDHQRVALAYAEEVNKIGIEARVRLVDASQFQTRSRSFDFDMMPFLWTRSHSPGNEQNYRWGSEAADLNGSYNFPGVRRPAADAMIDALVAARTRDAQVAAGRALDRVLLSGAYVVPLYHARGDRVAWWSHLRHPDTVPLSGYDLDSWWAVPEANTKPVPVRGDP